MFWKFLLTGVICISFAFVNFGSKIDIPKRDRLALRIISDSAQVSTEKYNIKPIGHTIHKGFSYMEISFEAFGDFSRDEIRSILLDCEDEFLSQINKKKEFQEYMTVSPMKHENVGILIFIYGKDGQDVYHPKIGIAECHRGTFRYRTMDPEKLFGYKETFEESYAEVVAIVKAQQASIAQSN